MSDGALNEFPKPDYGFSPQTNSPHSPEPNKPLLPGQDPQCNGTGVRWVDAYGNGVTCWRCAGTGKIPNLIPPKAAGVILEAAEGDSSEALEDGDNEEDTNQGNQIDEVIDNTRKTDE